MARIVRVHELGPPEVLRFEEIEVGAPGESEVRIRVEAVGLNRSKAMFRAGRYPTKPALPTLIGYEACGIVEALGKNVSGFAVGDRVCALPMYPLGQYGVWGEQAIVPACCMPRPDSARPKPLRSGCSI
jgi:NADPH:quinone reductase and related Zn-dependent oxidoreductases